MTEVDTNTYKPQGVFMEHTIPEQPHYEDMVIPVHGGGHAGWVFENYTKYFGHRGMHTLVPDWYDHGGSDPSPGNRWLSRGIEEVAANELATTVAFAREELGFRRIHLLGHSMGGLAAQKFVETNPVTSLTLLNTCAPRDIGNPYVPLPLRNRGFAFPYPMARFMFFGGMRRELAGKYYDDLHPESPSVIRQVSQGRRVGVPVDPAGVLANVGARNILVLTSHFDPLAPRRVGRAIARAYRAEFQDTHLIGHDHALVGQHWHEAAEQVGKFIFARARPLK